MLRVFLCVRDRHDLPLVMLAALVCLLTAAAMVALCREAMRETRGAQRWWLVTAGLVSGLGIWATHFIAMLAYQPGFVIGYHLSLTLVSLAVVLATSTVSLMSAARSQTRTACAAAAMPMGAGIAAMHYIGVAALEMPAIMRWHQAYVVASAVMAILPLVVAIPLAVRRQSLTSAVAATALTVAAVVLLHFTGMTAIMLIPSRATGTGATISPHAMSICVSLAVFSSLALAAVAGVVNRRAAHAMRRLDQQHLEQTERVRRQLDLALAHMHEGLCIYGADNRLVLWNRRFLELYHLSDADVCETMTIAEVARSAVMKRLMCQESDERIDQIDRLTDAMLGGKISGPVVTEYGEDFIISVATQPLPGGGWVTTYSDITQMRRSEARIKHMAMHDSLTGLPNRMQFHETLDQGIEVASRAQRRLGLVVLDLDGFKEINDFRGHAVGDNALKMLAGRLRAILRENETAARLGGDEFAAMILINDDKDLTAFVDRILSCFDDPGVANDLDFILKASIGVAIYPDDATTREQLCNNADLAMYRAKGDMLKSVCFYEQGMDEAARYRRHIAAELRGACERGELEILYQPQHSLRQGELNGYEALLRWHHPERGLITPDEFITIAEETGDIFAIGEWVLQEACREARFWPDHYKVAVNLSGVQLAQPNLAEIVAQILLETGLPPRRLELEITETAIIKDKARALHSLRKLKSMGISIAIDDFGTGYSSLDTLNSFPFDKIKIDKSFLIGVDDRPQARAIIRAVLALGRSLEVPVLAEGVETALHLDLLQAEGCEEVQGFLFGHPQRAPSLLAAENGVSLRKASAR